MERYRQASQQWMRYAVASRTGEASKAIVSRIQCPPMLKKRVHSEMSQKEFAAQTTLRMEEVNERLAWLAYRIVTPSRRRILAGMG